MKALIVTQIHENYGAHDWDGEGTCPEYWKAKGCGEYYIKDMTEDSIVEAMLVNRSKLEQDTDYYRESIIDFALVPDDYMSQYEKSQLEYEGRIIYPVPVIGS
jgi:hypothetical protein